MGVGNGTFPGLYEHGQGAVNQRIHPYFADTWKVTSSLTLNFGIGYDYESGLFYSNLKLPQYLSPILKVRPEVRLTDWERLNPIRPISRRNSASRGPSVKIKKTVIRGGGGMYWDTQPIWEHFREGAAIGPLGDGRTTFANSVFTNTFPGIYSAGGAPLNIGDPLPINTFTNLTLGQFIQIVQPAIPALLQRFGPTPPASGPYSVSGIDVAKQGIEIYPSSFPLLRSYQTSHRRTARSGPRHGDHGGLGRRQGENVNLGELDLNNFARYINGMQTPVIPICAANQYYVPGQECSTGSITIWTPEGRSVYDGLLVSLQKRMSHRVQFNVAYALQKQMNLSGGVDLDNWANGWGPNLARHNLNVAGTVNLPWGFTLSVINSIYSRSPVTPTISGIDLNGAGNTTFPITEAIPAGTIPGLSYNCFAVGCSKSQLTAAVNYWNTNIAGVQKTAAGGAVPKLILPSDYQFGDPLYDQDFRLTKQFAFRERYRLSIFGEFFNAFNIANLSGYGRNLDKVNSNPAAQSFAFGQPTARAQQVFGSGGPRAIQVGARVTF